MAFPRQGPASSQQRTEVATLGRGGFLRCRLLWLDAAVSARASAMRSSGVAPLGARDILLSATLSRRGRRCMSAAETSPPLTSMIPLASSSSSPALPGRGGARVSARRPNKRWRYSTSGSGWGARTGSAPGAHATCRPPPPPTPAALAPPGDTGGPADRSARRVRGAAREAGDASAGSCPRGRNSGVPGGKASALRWRGGPVRSGGNKGLLPRRRSMRLRPAPAGAGAEPRIVTGWADVSAWPGQPRGASSALDQRILAHAHAHAVAHTYTHHYTHAHAHTAMPILCSPPARAPACRRSVPVHSLSPDFLESVSPFVSGLACATHRD